VNKIHFLSAIILLIWGEHNDTIIGEADGIGIELGFDPGLEISMRGHLLNISEPYVICNKKRRSRWRVGLSKSGVEFYCENAFKNLSAILGAIFVPFCPHLSIHANIKGPQNWKPLY